MYLACQQKSELLLLQRVGRRREALLYEVAVVDAQRNAHGVRELALLQVQLVRLRRSGQGLGMATFALVRAATSAVSPCTEPKFTPSNKEESSLHLDTQVAVIKS